MRRPARARMARCLRPARTALQSQSELLGVEVVLEACSWSSSLGIHQPWKTQQWWKWTIDDIAHQEKNLKKKHNETNPT